MHYTHLVSATAFNIVWRFDPLLSDQHTHPSPAGADIVAQAFVRGILCNTSNPLFSFVSNKNVLPSELFPLFRKSSVSNLPLGSCVWVCYRLFSCLHIFFPLSGFNIAQTLFLSSIACGISQGRKLTNFTRSRKALTSSFTIYFYRKECTDCIYD